MNITNNIGNSGALNHTNPIFEAEIGARNLLISEQQQFADLLIAANLLISEQQQTAIALEQQRITETPAQKPISNDQAPKLQRSTFSRFFGALRSATALLALNPVAALFAKAKQVSNELTTQHTIKLVEEEEQELTTQHTIKLVEEEEQKERKAVCREKDTSFKGLEGQFSQINLELSRINLIEEAENKSRVKEICSSLQNSLPEDLKCSISLDPTKLTLDDLFKIRAFYDDKQKGLDSRAPVPQERLKAVSGLKYLGRQLGATNCESRKQLENQQNQETQALTKQKEDLDFLIKYFIKEELHLARQNLGIKADQTLPTIPELTTAFSEEMGFNNLSTAALEHPSSKEEGLLQEETQLVKNYHAQFKPEDHTKLKECREALEKLRNQRVKVLNSYAFLFVLIAAKEADPKATPIETYTEFYKSLTCLNLSITNKRDVPPDSSPKNTRSFSVNVFTGFPRMETILACHGATNHPEAKKLLLNLSSQAEILMARVAFGLGENEPLPSKGEIQERINDKTVNCYLGEVLLKAKG